MTEHPRPQQALAKLHDQVSGSVVTPVDLGYDEARAVWNGMVDRRPLAVVRATSTDDIAPTLVLARDQGLDLAVRGGGHNVAGNGSVDGGIVLDLGDLDRVSVDPEAATVRVEAGATLAQVDMATSTPISSGPCAAVAATSAWSLPSPSTPTRMGHGCMRARSFTAGSLAAGMGGP